MLAAARTICCKAGGFDALAVSDAACDTDPNEYPLEAV
jgi:hypothetical protein